MLQKLVCENQTVTGKSQNNVAMIKNWFSSCYSFLMITENCKNNHTLNFILYKLFTIINQDLYIHTYSTFKMYGLMLSILKNQTHNIKF